MRLPALAAKWLRSQIFLFCRLSASALCHSQVLAQRLHFNTFGGNPVCCAGGRAVLRAVDEDCVQANSAKVLSRRRKDTLVTYQTPNMVCSAGCRAVLRAAVEDGVQANSANAVAIHFRFASCFSENSFDCAVLSWRPCGAATC